MNQYQQFIHLSRYARWREDLNRRETWDETVDRYIGFFKKQCPQIPDSVFAEARDTMFNLEAIPSGRAMMTAGPALEQHHASGYNCTAHGFDDIRAFSELLYLLACGCGGAPSVERIFIEKLPTVASNFEPSDEVIVVEDSKIGWAEALRILMESLYRGKVPTWDVTKVRPAGARLKTFGGRASGPEPLVKLFEFTVKTFMTAAGRQLLSAEVADLACYIAMTIVVGGTRRSALLILSDLNDEVMRTYKSGDWWKTHPWRAMANISTAFDGKPTAEEFLREWTALVASGSGERGFYNRHNAVKSAEKYGRRDVTTHFGTNACGEINLRLSGGFCNLAETVVRADDTLESLKRKIRIATIFGTMQATLTDFQYLRPIWKENAEAERLLGVSLTGICDNELMNGKLGMDKLEETLHELREYVVEINKEFAELLGINPGVALTCTKPSGTLSQLVDCASGIHPRYAEYYVRTIRGDKKDPISQLLYMSGVPTEDEIYHPDSMWVFSFPQKAPERAITRHDRTAIEQLELYKAYKSTYTEHNVSITVYVRDSEWLAVGAWVYEHFDDLGGISFLPHDEGKTVYAQAPYQEVDKETYEELLSRMPRINWNSLPDYEKYDTTTNSHDLACTAGGCELI